MALQEWRKGRFTTDALSELSGGESFEGWTRGYTWNGFATPYFEARVAARLMAMENRLGLAKFKLMDGGVLYADSQGDGEFSEFVEARFVEGPNGIKVLPLGTMDWCWEEVGR